MTKTIEFEFIEKSIFTCPEVLTTNSTLIKEMLMFCDNTSEPVRLPTFITRDLLFEILKLLETKEDHEEFYYRSNIEYLLEVYKCADFLLIEIVCETIEKNINLRLDSKTCFEVYKMAKNIPRLSNISYEALIIISVKLENYYEDDVNICNCENTFYNDFCIFSFEDLMIIIKLMTKTSILSQIWCLQNWIKKNKSFAIKKDILECLEEINENASYVNKKRIIMMRKIKQEILKFIEIM